MKWTDELNYNQQKMDEFEHKMLEAQADPINYNETDVMHYRNRFHYYRGRREMLRDVIASQGMEAIEHITFTGSSVWIVLG